jgi:hypothetical protein
MWSLCDCSDFCCKIGISLIDDSQRDQGLGRAQVRLGGHYSINRLVQ